MMWHTAALSGSDPKKFPKLEKFLSSSKEKSVKGVDEGAIMARLKAYSKRYARENGNDISKTGS